VSTLVQKIADAVLYEGYILYPYRPSAVKNQQRWNFGVLCPESYSLSHGSTESWTMQTECLVRGSEATTLDVRIRFLHLLLREVCEPIPGTQPADMDDQQVVASDFRVVASLKINEQIFQTWQEAVERDVFIPGLKFGDLCDQSLRYSFAFPGSEQTEILRDERNGNLIAVIVRKQQPIAGVVEVTSERSGADVFKVTVRILNTTPLEGVRQKNWDQALMWSFISTHTILKVQKGEFVSLLDPPDACRELVARCANVGTFPVLAGVEGDRDCLLSSPIILYDYPQIAPESAGELFDGTEIDEILTLRIMTLTDEEKLEMRGVDARARKILERTETLLPEQLIRLHGVMKGVNRKS
jgi:hydrogenase maturation protease